MPSPTPNAHKAVINAKSQAQRQKTDSLSQTNHQQAEADKRSAYFLSSKEMKLRNDTVNGFLARYVRSAWCHKCAKVRNGRTTCFGVDPSDHNHTSEWQY
jgi:hypothetical protein